MALVEGGIRNWSRAEMVVHLLGDPDVTASARDIIHVVNKVRSLNKVKLYLRRLCADREAKRIVKLELDTFLIHLQSLLLFNEFKRFSDL